MDIAEAYLFIDWDAARRCSWLNEREAMRVSRHGVAAQLESVLRTSGATIGPIVGSRVSVNCRVYHGWHRGLSSTSDYRALSALPPSSVVVGNVHLRPPVLADTLACGGWYADLRDTLRRRDNGLDEQKMVDTALSVDLLHIVRMSLTSPNTWHFVLSEDDDMLPAIVTADAWSSRCRVIRMRAPNPRMPRVSRFVHHLTPEESSQ